MLLKKPCVVFTFQVRVACTSHEEVLSRMASDLLRRSVVLGSRRGSSSDQALRSWREKTDPGEVVQCREVAACLPNPRDTPQDACQSCAGYQPRPQPADLPVSLGRQLRGTAGPLVVVKGIKRSSRRDLARRCAACRRRRARSSLFHGLPWSEDSEPALTVTVHPPRALERWSVCAVPSLAFARARVGGWRCASG